MKMYVETNDTIRKLLDTEKEQFLNDYRELDDFNRSQGMRALSRWCDQLNIDTSGVYGETDEEVIEQYFQALMDSLTFEVDLLSSGDVYFPVVGADGHTYESFIGKKEELNFLDF